MKRLSFIIITLTLIFTSCNTESVDVPNVSENIIGVWRGVGLDYSGKTVTDAQGQTITADFTGEAYDMDYTLTFKENPNAIVSEGNYSLKLTTTVLGQTSVQNLENIEFLEAESWTKTDNILSISSGNESYDYAIIELTNSKLILSISTEENLSQQGVSVISTINATMTFSR